MSNIETIRTSARMGDKQERPGTALRRIRRHSLLAVAALALAGMIGTYLHWPEKLYLHASGQWHGRSATDGSMGLSGYRVRIDAKPIAGIRNLSGITYDHDRDRLLTVSNTGSGEDLALDRNGEVLGRYRLEGFVDVEGLAYLGNGRLALVEEISQRLSLVELPATGETIRAQDARSLALEINTSQQNKGFEGIAYDAGQDRLFVVKERDPRQLYEIGGVTGSFEGRLQLRIRDLSAWIEHDVFATDLSDIHHDRRTGHLVLLSDESKLLVELNGDGRFVGFRSLRGLDSDLGETAPQPEGVTMDSTGDLYVVSEPNLFYAFRRAGSGHP